MKKFMEPEITRIVLVTEAVATADAEGGNKSVNVDDPWANG